MLLACSKPSMSTGGMPRIRSRLRTALSAISAVVRSVCDCCQSCRLPPFASNSACFRVSIHAREPHLSGGGAQIILCLHEFRSIDAGERCARLDRISQAGNDPRDPAGVGREHRRGVVGVDGDLALGHFLADEGMLAHRRDGQCLQLLRGGAKSPGRRGRRPLRFIVRTEGSVAEPDCEHDDHGRNDANGRDAPLARRRPCTPIDRRPAERVRLVRSRLVLRFAHSTSTRLVGAIWPGQNFKNEK